MKVVATFYADLFIDENRPFGQEKFYVVEGVDRALMCKETALRYSVLQLGVTVPVGSLTANTIDSVATLNILGEPGTEAVFPKFKMPPVVLNINADVRPRRRTYTNIPFAWKEVARKRIDDMVKSDIIEEIKEGMDTRHCSSMLAVPKGTDDVRLVVDLRGPNECVIREPHKMPTLDSILSELHGSEMFSTIDLSNAFSHVELAEESRYITNFFSGDGFYRFKRLPFGLCNAPDIFQSAMEKILAGVNGVLIYLDDILVHGKSKAEHDEILKTVLERLAQHGVRLNDSKCKFGRKSVTFLGFQISNTGYKVTEDRLSSISAFRIPKNVAEVRSFLGLMNFVDRFIYNRATKTRILQKMIRTNEFSWNDETQNEFDFLKDEVLKDIRTLGFFHQGDKTELVVDASPEGLGAVLVQFDDEDKPRIIACASKALTTSEKNYPQVQREALAIVWGVERFQLYLRGQMFTVKTDSEGNEYIFGERHRMGKRCITRAEAWALRLQPYKFKIERVPGKDNIADVFSRLVAESQRDEPFDDSNENHLLLTVDTYSVPVTWLEVNEETTKDENLQAVRKGLDTNEWADKVKVFKALRHQLTFVGGVLVFRNKMVVPVSLQNKILQIAHRGHFGMNSMKRMLRQSVWWPNINKQVESLVGNCETCQRVTKLVRPIPLSSRELPDGPWQRIQIDFLKLPDCGTGEFLMVSDTYSRMIWAIEMRRTDTTNTIRALWDIFAIWGRPDVIQSDNGPPFNSPSFTNFWKKHGVTHLTVVPLSPWMNGMVERSNEGVIKAMTTAKLDGTNWRDALQNYVSKYNNIIPHSTTGATPFELMTGRMFQGCLPIMRRSSNSDDEDVRERDAISKLKSVTNADMRRGAKVSEVAEGDWVWLCNKQRKNKLDSAYLPQRFEVLSRDRAAVLVRSEDGREYKRWVSEVKKIGATGQDQESFGIGDVVTNLRKNRSDKKIPHPFMKDRFKVLHKDEGKLLIRSENGAEFTQSESDVELIDSFEWNTLEPTGPEIDEQKSSDEQEEVEVRPRRNIKLPGRFTNCEMYNLFG